MCVRSCVPVCVCVGVCVCVCLCAYVFVCASAHMLNTHGSLESCRHYQSIEMYVAEGFCAVDDSHDFMQVTWCIMSYIHDCNELSFTWTKRVRE